MDDPIFSANITVGGKGSTYRFDALSKSMHSNQSFVLELTFLASGGGAFDISSAVATLFVTTFNNADADGVFILDGGVLSDSGSGTVDRVTFTVIKDLIPDSLGNFPQRNGGNSVFYFVLEDTDSILEFSEGVNVIDPNFAGTGTIDPGAGAIVVSKNDLGTVTDTVITTPPTADLNLSYIVGVGSTGDWSGHDNELTIGNGTDWLFTIPVDGNFVFDLAADQQKRFNGSTWETGSNLVTSVFTRIGDVVATNGDYTASQVTNVPAGTIVAVTTQAAITELDANDATQQTAINLNSSHRVTVSGNPHAVSASQVGNTVSQWNANALAGKDLSTGMSTPSNGDVAIFNSSSQKWEPGAQSGGGTSGRPPFESNFDTDITGSEPASGAVKFDDATPGSVTTIRASTSDILGNNITNQLSSIGLGDAFMVFQVSDKTKFLYFTVTSSTLVITSYDIVGTAISSGVAIDNGAACGIAAFVLTAGVASAVSSFNFRTGAILPALGDYTGALITDTSGVGGSTVSDSLDILNTSISPEGIASGTDDNRTGTLEDLVLTNKDNNTVWMNNASPNNLRIPLNATVAFPIGTKINVMREGVGITTVTGVAGVTVNSVSGGSVDINNRYQGATLTQRSIDTWIIGGDIT